jgi:SAM-dependent methyltransferase
MDCKVEGVGNMKIYGPDSDFDKVMESVTKMVKEREIYMNYDQTWGQNTGEETRKSWKDKYWSGFFEKYMSGNGLDIGYAGYIKDVHPVLPAATGIDLSYPGYDGRILPFPDESQDYVYSSHFLEHVTDYKNAIQEQFRVTNKGGHIIIVVPHRDLYEKKTALPSRWNADHKRFYTSSSLLKEIEDSLPINSYRIRHLLENDTGHDYNDGPDVHGRWNYEIEVVLEKL